MTMAGFFKGFRGLRRDRRGVTALEYGLIAASVVAIGLAGFSVIGQQVAGKMSCVSDTMDGTQGDSIACTGPQTSGSSG